MANKFGRKPGQPAPFNPRGALPEGNVPVVRLSGESEAMAGRALATQHQALSTSMGALSGKLSDWADKAAVIEGTRAGAVAGMDPAFRPKGSATLRGQAFERAAVQTYADRLDAQMRADIARVADANAGNPGALHKGFAALRQEYRQQHLFPEIEGSFEATFQRATLGPMRQAQRTAEARAKAERLAALEESLAERSKGLNRLAYTSGLDGAADEAIAGELTDLRAALEATGPDGQPLVSPQAAGDWLRNATKKAARARVVGTFDQLDSIGAKERFLAQFDADFADGAEHLDAFDLDDFQRLRGALADGVAAARAQASRGLRLLENEVKGFEALAAKGFALPDEQMEELTARVAAAGDPAVMARMLQAGANVELLRTGARHHPAEVEHWVNSERARLAKEGTSEPELERLELVETQLQNMRKELGRDPIGWAQRASVIPVQPFNFEPAVDAETDEVPRYRQRRVDAAAVANRYGVPPKFFTAAERDALANKLQSAPPKDRADLVEQLVTGFGDDGARAMAEIADKAPAAAYLGGLMALGSQHAENVREAFVGLDAIKNGVIAVPKEKADKRLDLWVGAAVDHRLPGLRDQLSEATKAIYAARALARGTTASFDQALFDEAIQAAAGGWDNNGVQHGGLGQFNGRNLFLPQHMSESQFEATIVRLKDEDLEKLSFLGGAPMHRVPGGRMVRAKAGELKDYFFVSVGNGRYQVSRTDPSYDFAPLFDVSAGHYWEIDLSHVKPGGMLP